MDPNNSEDRSKFFKALKRSWETLRPFRENREQLIRDYVGSHYSNNGPDKEIIINLMQTAAEATVMRLTANRPQVLVSTEFLEHETFAKRFEAATNNAIKEMRLEEQLERVALDAFFSIGVMKVFMAPIGPVEYRGMWIDPGTPYAERISLDNFVFDANATEWEKIRFAADWFEVEYAEVKANPDYDPEAVELLDPDRRNPHEMNGERPARELSWESDHTPEDQMGQTVRLMEVYFPKEQLIVVWPFGFQESKPLQVRPWDGPEYGPYHILSYNDVPDNIMPVAPAQSMKPLHDLLNGLLRKQRRQAQRQKDILTYQGDAADDVRRIQKTSDGEMVRVNRPDAFSQLKFGGVDQGNQAFALRVQDLLNQAGGNIEAMAGLGPQSDTLGQDQLIHGAVSKREAKMKQRLLRFTSRVAEAIGWMVWVDKIRYVPIRRMVEGIDFPIVSEWTPEEREGDFLQYNFDVDPHSMEYRSPEERAQAILGLMERIYVPLQQQMAEQGAHFDWAEMTNLLADMLGLHRLKHIVRFDGPTPFERPGPAGEQPRQAPHTVREHVRRNIPTGGTDQSRRQTLMQTLLNQSANPDQLAALSR